MTEQTQQSPQDDAAHDEVPTAREADTSAPVADEAAGAAGERSTDTSERADRGSDQTLSPSDDEAAVDADAKAGDVATDAAPVNAPARRSGAQRLEEEGDVAADYLEELLDIVDLDGDIDIDVENGRASVSVVADPVSSRSLRRLAGPEGEVLEALQELTRLAVQARTGERSRLMLDVAGFRAARRQQLEELAGRAVAECRRTGAPVRLDPMTPFERKVVHDAIAAAGLASESEGEEPARRVVVLAAADEA